MSTIQPRTSVVTIYQGDFLDRIRHVERQHEAAVKAEGSTPRMISEASSADSIAAEHEALVAEAEASALHVTVKALGRKAWRALVAAHPPRVGNKDDEAAGVDESTFKDVLIAASIVEPDLTEDDLDQLSDIDNDRLYFTAFALNRAAVAGPKALPASQPNQASDAT